MIHDIKPKAYDLSFRNAAPDENSHMLYIKGNTVMVEAGRDEIVFPRPGEVNPVSAEYTYLFSIDGEKFFLGREAEPQGRFEYREIMELRVLKPKHLAFAAATAYQLSVWYEDNKFCGRCGELTVPDERERMLRCDSCGNMIYPRISPGVIVGVTDGDKLLLTKYAGRRFKNYALIAGFTEIGEPIEDTVSREVLEEAGVRVKNIRFYKSQPWLFSGSLLMGFYCELDGPGDITLDEAELECAHWIKREDITTEFDDISLTNEMIVRFKNGE